MSEEKFVVLVTVAGAGDITVRYHPNFVYLKTSADEIEPGKGVGDVWPRDIRAIQLKDTQHLVTLKMLGHYIEITTASGRLEWGEKLTSAVHKTGYVHSGL